MISNNEETKKATILVVDDTPDNLTIMSNVLEDIYTVKVANRGEKGVKIAKSANPPDLILLDIMMPEMDGYEVCRILKADPNTADIPIIFLTAKNEAEDEISGFTLGAVDYITKPIQADVTLARIKRHLAIKLAQDKQRDAANRLRDQLAYMKKLSSMGQLTEGVAHEFNNILCKILCYTEIGCSLLDRFKEEISNEENKSNLENNLAGIQNNVQKATSLIDKMLIYCNQGGQSNQGMQEIDLKPTKEVIENVISTLEFASKIELELISELDIKINSTSLHQVLANLLENAHHATNLISDAKIKISLQEKTIENEELCIACANQIKGKFIELNVSDNGSGMDKETITKIFDPFFTTKEVGEGTGLGLSVVSGLVHQANGHITVTSVPNEQTVFNLLFEIS